MRNVTLRSIPVLAVMALLPLQSCGVWDSFTAYFNTYYNAQRLFQEAEDEIWAAADTKESGRNLLIPLNVSQGVRTKLASVIEKCSKLLQYHPESGLVEDALLMIGKSYYYQNEYQKADRKFHELIDGYPESDLLPEARVLLSFAQYKSGDIAGAGKLAQQVLEKATADGEDAIRAEAALVLGQIAFDEKAYARARPFYVQVGEYANTPDKRTQAWLKVGELLALEREYAAAGEAYQRARSASLSYVGEFRALLGAAKMLDKEQRFDDAQAALEELRSNSNYKEFFGEIDYELGNVFRDRGDIEAAIEQYKYVDTAYARTVPAADANLALGMLYENVLMNFDSAKVVFEKGARSAATTAESRLQIVRRADYLSKYIAYRNEIAKLDSLLDAALHPPDTVSRSGGRLAADTTALAIADTAMRARTDSVTHQSPAAPPMPIDTIHVRRATRMDDLGGLFYATMGLPDSARYWYRRLLREYPASRAAPRALYVLAQIEAADSSGGRTVADSLRNHLIDEFPDSPFAEESKRQLGLPPSVKATDPLEISYRAASLLLEKGRHAAAIDTFKSIVRRAPESPIAPRALYAAAWTYEYQTRLLDSAAANYERLVALYPNSKYAQRVQPRVAEIQNARKAALAPKQADSTSAAPAVKQAEGPAQPAGAKSAVEQGGKLPPPPGEKLPPPPGEKPPERPTEKNPPPPAEESIERH